MVGSFLPKSHCSSRSKSLDRMTSQTILRSHLLIVFRNDPTHGIHRTAVASLQVPRNYYVTPISTTKRRRRGRNRIEGSLRDKGLSKKPLWRTAQDMSSEAIQASRALILASSDPQPQNAETKVEWVFQTKIARLLKSDLLSLLFHLQRLDNCHLSLKVFEYARKESWYKPEIALFYDMIYLLARNKMVAEAEYYFLQLKEEGLVPDTRLYTEMIGAYMEVGMIDKAMGIYATMKGCGCKPNELTFTLLIKNFMRFGRDDLVGLVKEDVEGYLDEPEDFFRKLERKNRKK